MKHVFPIISRFDKITLVLLKKIIVNSKVLKYPCYKTVVIDENPKTGFSDNKKTQKILKNIKMSSKNFMSALVYKLLILFVS